MNALNWFEIPTADIERAHKFYNAILAQELIRDESMGVPMVFLPAESPGVGGALITGNGYAPSKQGSRVYLNGGEDLQHILDRVEGAGGKVIEAKMSLGPHGFAAVFEDSEGNLVGLHSMQ